MEENKRKLRGKLQNFYKLNEFYIILIFTGLTGQRLSGLGPGCS